MVWFKKHDKSQPVEASPVAAPAVVTAPASTPAAQRRPALALPLRHVKHPVVSEKASRLQAQGQYTFAVAPGSSKIQLAREVQVLYGVHVVKVTTVNLPGKTVLSRGRPGRRSPRRYLRVHLAPGETIDISKT